MVNGYALGGGLELAMACHLRVAADNARLGQPEVNLGLIPGFGGTQRLLRLAGRAATLELCLLGTPIDAARALQLGLVNRVVPAADLESETMKLAAQLASAAPLALRGVLDAVVLGGECGIEEGLQFETAQFALLFASEDMREGTDAFLMAQATSSRTAEPRPAMAPSTESDRRTGCTAPTVAGAVARERPRWRLAGRPDGLRPQDDDEDAPIAETQARHRGAWAARERHRARESRLAGRAAEARRATFGPEASGHHQRFAGRAGVGGCSARSRRCRAPQDRPCPRPPPRRAGAMRVHAQPETSGMSVRKSDGGRRRAGQGGRACDEVRRRQAGRPTQEERRAAGRPDEGRRDRGDVRAPAGAQPASDHRAGIHHAVRVAGRGDPVGAGHRRQR